MTYLAGEDSWPVDLLDMLDMLKASTHRFRLRRGRQRQTDRERAALAQLAANQDAAVVGCHDVTANGKTQPRAIRLGRVERLEDELELFRRDPRARIDHLDEDVVLSAARRELEL